tara:strand:+ start:553 stop:1467 length:915 start_codon:yes stop_codon:yes gene_type:complete
LKESLNENDFVDLTEIIKIFWVNKIFILSFSFFFGVFSIFYSLSLPNIYTSSAVLQISSEENQTQLSSFGNQLSSLASFAGIAQIGGSDKTEFALAKLKSREFVKHLISVRDISPEIIAADFFSNETDTLSFDDQYDLSSKKWVRKPSQNKKVIPSILEIHSELNKSFNASLDKDSGFIKLEFSHISPIFAKDFLDLAIKEINNIAKQKDKLESAKALDYLQIELRSTQKKDIIDSINAVIRNQLNKKMLSNIKDDYLLSTIDAPFVPEKKSSPSRALICIFYTLIGTLLGIIIVYLRKIFLST